MFTTKRIIAGLVLATAAFSASATTLSLGTAGGGWKAITPSTSVTNNSYPSPSPIGSVGTAWEAANVGWNSSASYDDSAWSAYSGGWGTSSGVTPFYGRNVFNISGTGLSGTFTLYVDDDAQLWVNGWLVFNDNNMGTSNPYSATVNISSYLVSGENVIAFKAHNSAGGGYGVYGFGGSVDYTPAEVPEPASLALACLGLLGGAFVSKRRANA